MKKTMNSIGWKYGLMAIVYIILNYGISILLRAFAPDFTEKNSILLTYAMVIFTVDMVCFPLVLLLTSKMPKAEIEKKRLGFGKFLLCILLMYGLILVGAVIGSIINFGLTIPFKSEENTQIVELLVNSNSFLRILIVGIIGPIFEELIFRKVLIDHVAPKGELVAILASGIMFGLFHGNFQQCFFAGLIGCLFAYIYLKTGRVIYTILLHMILNTITSGITIELIKWMFKAAEGAGIDLNATSTEMVNYSNSAIEALILPTLALIAWVFVLFIVMLAGLVTFIVIACMKKIKIERKEEEPSFKEQAASLVTAPCMWIFYLAVAFLFVVEYLPPIIEFFMN